VQVVKDGAAAHNFPIPLKVFDMGLAKELDDSYKPDKDGLYNLTGMTGSPRYMVRISIHLRRMFWFTAFMAATSSPVSLYDAY